MSSPPSPPTREASPCAIGSRAGSTSPKVETPVESARSQKDTSSCSDFVHSDSDATLVARMAACITEAPPPVKKQQQQQQPPPQQQPDCNFNTVRVKQAFENSVQLLQNELQKVHKDFMCEIDRLVEIENELHRVNSTKKTTEQKMSSYKRRLTRSEQDLCIKSEQVSKLSDKLKEADDNHMEKMAKHEKQLQEMRCKFNVLEEQIDVYNKQNEELECQIQAYREQLKTNDEALKHHKTLNLSYEKTIESKKSLIENLQQQISKYVHKICDHCCSDKNSYRNDDLHKECEKELAEAKCRIDELERQLEEHEENACIVDILNQRLNEIDCKLVSEMSRNSNFFQRMSPSRNDSIMARRSATCSPPPNSMPKPVPAPVNNQFEDIFCNLQQILKKLLVLEQMNDHNQIAYTGGGGGQRNSSCLCK